MTTPVTTPATIARPTPMTKLVPLYAMSDFSRPIVHSSMKRWTTADGPVKNSGEILPADQSHCHAASTAMTAVPPTITGS